MKHILFLLLCACTVNKKTFRTEDVTCKNAEKFNCGYTLWDCSDNQTHECVTNIEITAE